MGDKVSIVLKSPVYGHNTFYFDSCQGIGQIVMSWDMTTDVAQIWVNYLKWNNVIELGTEFHSKVLKPYGPERDAANEKVLDHLDKKNVHFEDAWLIATVHTLWNMYRNNLLLGDKRYDDAMKRAFEEKKSAKK